MKNIGLYIYLTFQQWFKSNQMWISFSLVVLVIFITDSLFAHISPKHIEYVYKAIGSDALDYHKIKEFIGFAPEAWLGLLGLVLGTLIVVISIASQSTPKLIDLYTRDQTSLFYIWYIVVGSVHNLYLQPFEKVELKDEELATIVGLKNSMLFNTYILLPLALLLAVPYVLYILRYTKTGNVINKISGNNLRRIAQLRDRSRLHLLDDKKEIANYQYELFESLNQLDNLLEYVEFKEPKGEIIHNISLAIQAYIRVKDALRDVKPKQTRGNTSENTNKGFFGISHAIATDVSFKTMTEQFAEMEKTETFFEQKGYRLLGNTYQNLIEDNDFDLASLCAYELSECGRAAVISNEWEVVSATLVRFNTLLRFAIKHGLKNKEPRNLYNAIFHYSGFIKHIVSSHNEEYIRRSCFYLNAYVNEIYRHSREEPVFVFLVDAFTWEFKRILMELNEQKLNISLQKDILGYFLRIDNLSDAYEEPSLKGRRYRAGLRSLQISLALYYLSVAQTSLAESIVIDILSDHEFMDREVLREAVQNTCQGLRNASERFWEDTDRGNYNLYYSEHKDQVDAFLSLFEERLTEFALLARRNASKDNEA